MDLFIAYCAGVVSAGVLAWAWRLLQQGDQSGEPETEYDGTWPQESNMRTRRGL